MNGPGAWSGVSFEPVNAPQIRKIATTEMIDAMRLGVTALSSPKVTVFSEVKSCARFADAAVMNCTAKNAPHEDARCR